MDSMVLESGDSITHFLPGGLSCGIVLRITTPLPANKIDTRQSPILTPIHHPHTYIVQTSSWSFEWYCRSLVQSPTFFPQCDADESREPLNRSWARLAETVALLGSRYHRCNTVQVSKLSWHRVRHASSRNWDSNSGQRSLFFWMRATQTLQLVVLPKRSKRWLGETLWKGSVSFAVLSAFRRCRICTRYCPWSVEHACYERCGHRGN